MRKPRAFSARSTAARALRHGGAPEIGDSGLGPIIASSMRAASSASRAKGPCTWPGSQASDIGWFGVRPGVGRMPTIPQNAAGTRTEPPKSVPCAIGTMPVATATAEPPEEPAGLSAGFQGLRVTPNTALTVWAPAANSGVLVLASTIAPAALRRRTTSASSSGTKSLNRGEPKVVRMPAVRVMSLTASGRPWSAPSSLPRMTAASAARAASRAFSATSVTMALRFGLTRAMTARCASNTSSGLTARVRISDASSHADLRVRVSSAIELVGHRGTCVELLAGPMDEPALDEKKHQVEAVAQRAGGENRRVHVGHLEQLLGLEHPLAESIGRADEHLGHHHDDQRQRHAAAQADEGLRQGFEQSHVGEHAQRRGAHHLRRQQAGLARVHHPVGDVEQDDQQRAEGGDRDFRLVANAEDDQEQREHG